MDGYSFKTKIRKLVSGICIFSAFSFFCFAKETLVKGTNEIKIFTLDECNDIFSSYYKTGKIYDEDLEILIQGIKFLTETLEQIVLEDKKIKDIEKQNENLILYLEHAEIISTIYNYGGINHHSKIIKKIDKDLKRFLQLSDLKGEVYLKYADYLYTKLPLPETKRFNIVLALPVLYRKTILKDKNNRAALVKLSCWQISAADATTSNFNSQIKANEVYIEDLNEIDKFNAYLWYSIFYMKIYDTKKGWTYFYSAKNIFPDHPMISLLYENYKKGIFSL